MQGLPSLRWHIKELGVKGDFRRGDSWGWPSGVSRVKHSVAHNLPLINLGHYEGVSSLVLVTLPFDEHQLSGLNLYNWGRSVPFAFVLPRFPDLLQLGVGDGEVFACVLISCKVDLARRHAVLSYPAVKVGDGTG